GEEVCVDELVRDIADHDHALLSSALDPRGEVGGDAQDRVAGDDVDVPAGARDHDLAGMDSHAQLSGGSDATLQLGTPVVHRHYHVQASEHRATRVVLVHLGIAEPGQDAVPE